MSPFRYSGNKGGEWGKIKKKGINFSLNFK